ncbi:MAG: SigB/SigF/SigG family RNA polymerase sigma factor [Bacillota bacterium]|jgi:RNA polymerase sporulation-specific sigma factor|nr:SigB/SigF/SigG family RNA polymerase sigma factor [Bacillota bacterium]HHU42920.1 SigB/SigF/SigG family RNA polymerase sigma factor [Clostridiales bacterium]
MLQNEETLQLIKEAQNGSDEAKTLLLYHNLPLIKSIVRRYKNKQIEYDDLIQLGTLGLIKAINNFDTSFGVRFSTYAVPMIAGEIKRFIRDDGAIKVSRSIKAQSQKINAFIEEYRHIHQKDPTISEIAEEFDIGEQDVVFTLDSSKYPVSLYTENDEDGLSLIDRLSAKGCQDDEIDKIIIKDLIKNLDERDKKIIYLRYYRDKTQSEIARELGVSQVQISRLEARIIEKLKKELV